MYDPCVVSDHILYSDSEIPVYNGCYNLIITHYFPFSLPKLYYIITMLLRYLKFTDNYNRHITLYIVFAEDALYESMKIDNFIDIVYFISVSKANG